MTILKVTSPLLFLCLFLFTSCEPDLLLQNEEPAKEYEFVELTKQGDQIGGLKLPEGTSVWKMAIKGGKAFKFTFPEDITLISKNKTGGLSSFGELTYTCTCSETGGCDVFKSGNLYGCLHKSCTGTCSGEFTEEDAYFTSDFKKHVFVNKSLGINYVRKMDEKSSLFTASPVLLDLPEVKDFITGAQVGLEASKANGEETQIVFINIYGSKIALEVSMNAKVLEDLKSITSGAKIANPIVSATSFGEVSCACNSGEEGCTLYELEAGIALCSAGECTKCSMTVGGGANQ